MFDSPTILLLVSDESLVRSAAASLGAACYRTIRSAGAAAREPDLVLRQWNDDTTDGLDTSAPVLNVDLTRLRDRDLVHLVDRVVGFPAIVMRCAARSHA